MKSKASVALVVLVVAVSSNAVAQQLNVGSLQSGAPPAWGQLPASDYAAGLPVFGYQFRYGSFEVKPGPSLTVNGIFALTKQPPFPVAVQKLYSETLTYVGYNPQGVVFQGTVNGATRYFLFGTIPQGTQDGVELRWLRYFDSSGTQVYATLARFYTPS